MNVITTYNILCDFSISAFLTAPTNEITPIVVDVVARFSDRRGRNVRLSAEGRGRLAGKSDDRQAVGAVGRDFKLDDRVGEQQCLANVFADFVGEGLAENADTVLDRLGHIVRGQPQLADGAEHTVRLHAAELAGLDVYAAGQGRICLGDRNHRALENILRAGHNLHRLARTDVDRADLQVVGVFVLFNGQNPSDDDIFDVGAEHGVALDLRAGVGHAVAEGFIRNIADVDEVGQPVS